MPNVSSHIGVALKVKEKLNINDDSFIYGSILPDLLDMDKRKSHYKIQGKEYLIPNLENYLEINDISNILNLGYYLHLYIDFHFLEDYLYKYNKGIDVFDGSDLYYDYDIINEKLIKHFSIDADEIEHILNKYSDAEVSDKKLETNLRCLRQHKSGKYTYLDEDRFIEFLDSQVDNFIIEYNNKIK
jgi:hypothetical protein